MNFPTQSVKDLEVTTIREVSHFSNRLWQSHCLLIIAIISWQILSLLSAKACLSSSNPSEERSVIIKAHPMIEP